MHLSPRPELKGLTEPGMEVLRLDVLFPDPEGKYHRGKGITVCDGSSGLRILRGLRVILAVCHSNFCEALKHKGQLRVQTLHGSRLTSHAVVCVSADSRPRSHRSSDSTRRQLPTGSQSNLQHLSHSEH